MGNKCKNHALCDQDLGLCDAHHEHGAIELALNKEPIIDIRVAQHRLVQAKALVVGMRLMRILPTDKAHVGYAQRCSARFGRNFELARQLQGAVLLRHRVVALDHLGRLKRCK
jgi:hypothetical protein